MKSSLTKLILPLLLVVALAGCAGLFKSPQPLTFTPTEFQSGQYTAKADNFQLLLDASQTMGNNGQVNFLTAKNFLGAVNASLPADFGANMGLRSLGHSERQSKNLTDLVAGMSKYSRDDMTKGLEKVKYPGGNTPLGAAINAASADLEKAAGTSVLVIVSDGTINNLDDAIAAAKAIKAKMGDRICIYTVWVGDDVEGKKILENVSKTAGCGFTESIANLTDAKSLAAYVEKVFLNRKPAAPVPVAAPAPAPAPAPMAEPCKGVITANLVFDFDKATIKDQMIPTLEEVKRILGECRTTTYKVAGHTCNIGTDTYNQGLSERRAAAVKKWLVDNGVDAGRLDAVGYGEGSPKYDNKTGEGRNLNRRVEFQTK
jgi:OOP family OmpA-OmpF porin